MKPQSTTYQVTETNTHKDKYKNEYKEILFGDSYTKHTFKTREEALQKQTELEKQGIRSRINSVQNWG